MDKNKHAERFARLYGTLNETERSGFSRIANKLLSSSFLCEAKDTDTKDYYDCQMRLSLFQDYFAIMDYEVILHANEKVIQLRNTEHYNHLNLRLSESVVLLLLRKLYAVKSREVSLNENVIITMEEVHDAITEIGYLRKRMNKTEFREILRLFKRFSLVNNIGEFDRDDSLLILYPSIACAAPYEDLTAISKLIQNYGREENDEAPDEDPAD